jgi:hypothetical protein
LIGLGHAHAMFGEREKAQEIIDGLLEQAKVKPMRPTSLAIIYAGLNDRDRAFEWLEKGYENRYESALYLKVQPFYDSLRPDPRYADLLRRVGFGEEQ